ncbi:hypothetical protein MRB53_028091 [Persea americana]|uniref:Uncharacterized protein n=1 Tax=Persea americana TaxID=3435 RepID=A0ACC2KF17_PERAE|nr:hypothetical protein MRB53_028091 [Persea americana]
MKKAKVEGASGTLMKETMMERKRRGKMSNFYSELQFMVPNIPPKATRTSIVDGTISYIQELENTLKELEARKKAQLNNRFSLHTLKTSSVDVTVSGTTAFFGIRSLSRKGLASAIIRIFEAHEAEVLSTGIASEEGREMSMTVNAVINGGEGGEAVEFVMSKIKRDLLLYLS